MLIVSDFVKSTLISESFLESNLENITQDANETTLQKLFSELKPKYQAQKTATFNEAQNESELIQPIHFFAIFV
jgi:hypothetical protein